MNCIFCEQESFKVCLCRNHYLKFVSFKNDIIVNHSNKYDIKSHYHNLRYSILKSSNIGLIENNLIRLIALADVYSSKYNDSSLLEVCFDFSRKIFVQKLQANNRNMEEYNNFLAIDNYDYDIRKLWPRNYRSEDGHCLRSSTEVLIDNWLFTHNIRHSYEKRISVEIDGNIIYLIPDFYLNDLDVYVEYWGMNNKEYISKKVAKKMIYSKSSLHIIEIDYQNIQNLSEYLQEKISYYQSHKMNKEKLNRKEE